MALNGDTKRPSVDRNGRPPMHIPFDSWVSEHGRDAYKVFAKDHPKTDLSYEGWRQTDRVYGGYLFFVASLIWNEDGDSDQETPKRRRISRVPGDNPRKVAATNGTGATRNAGSATPTPVTIPDEINASGKRKRKPRKKYMSQEIVASDEEVPDEVDATTPKADAEASAALETTANGRRKSGSRRPRKKPISDEIISPEDEDDDPMEIDVPAPTLVSPLPVRSAPHAESSKKASPKQASVRKSRTSLLVRLPFHLWDAVNLEEKSEEMVNEKEIDDNNDSIAEVSRPATTPSAKPKNGTSNDFTADNNVEDVSEAAIPNGTPDPSAANARRGLRNRKPAQQRPYYHDAQVFEDVESESDDNSELESVPRAHSLEPPSQSKPKHFKGKGRAWKKEGSDEDEEFVTPKEKKVAKAAKSKTSKEEKAKSEKEKANGQENDVTLALWNALVDDASELITAHEESKKANASSKDPSKQKKKIGRPRKSNLSEDIVRDDSDNDTPQATPTQQARRGRGRPRKSALSSELVRDESDDEAPASETKQPSPAPTQKAANGSASLDLTTPPKPKTLSRPSTANSATTPKKRGRPRKSDAIATPAVPSEITNEDTNDNKSQQPASTTTESVADPKQENTPATEPNGDYLTPTANRGAALIESLYPRDSPAPSASVPTPAPAAPAPASTDPQTSTVTTANIKSEAEPEQDTQSQTPIPAAAAAAAAAAPSSLASTAQTSDATTVPPPPPLSPPAAPAAPPSTSPLTLDASGDPAPAPVVSSLPSAPTDDITPDEQDEGEMSAAMSLSSDGEL